MKKSDLVTGATIAAAVVAASLAAGGLVMKLSPCVSAPKSDDMRCLRVEPFPPRYLGPGVPMKREASAGEACEPAVCS